MADDFYTPDANEIRNKFLRDLELGLTNEGADIPALDEGSEYYILGTAVGNMMSIGYAQLRQALRNLSELDAEGAQLDRIRDAVGLPVVDAEGASGRIQPIISAGGSVTFIDGLEFTLDRNGLRGKVDGKQTITAGGLVKVKMLDKGADSNAASEESVTLKSPPNNVATTAYVGPDGLTGGVDIESDERKRNRILNKRRNSPGGGNWGQLVEVCEASTGSVQKAFAYPALLGPSYAKAVVTKSFQLDRSKVLDFSRELGESSVDIVEAGVLGEFPQSIEIVTQSCADELVDCTIGLTLPDPQHGGWYDEAPWPALVGADNGRVTVSAKASNTQITVAANTGTSPTIGQHIAWWSPDERVFVGAEITAVSGSVGAWVLSLNRPLSTGNVSVSTGDFISPEAFKMGAYGQSLLKQFNSLGPGENTTDAARLPRAKRHPFINQLSWPSDLTSQQLKGISNEHDEIIDFEWKYRSLTSPTVPASESDPPNLLVPRHVGIYAI